MSGKESNVEKGNYCIICNAKFESDNIFNPLTWECPNGHVLNEQIVYGDEMLSKHISEKDENKVNMFTGNKKVTSK